MESFRARQQSSVEETEQCREESQGKESTQTTEERCSAHGKRLLFFCEDDQEALCSVCQLSRRHNNHQFIPLKEAAKELKVL